MKNKILAIFLIFFLILFIAYLFQAKKINYTEKEILNAVYSNYKTPKGFFKDTLKEGENIFDIPSYLRLREDNNWIFYCTNDINTAKQKIDEKIEKNNYNLININQNEKFFEFKTLKPESKNFPNNKYYLSYRVYKCSYLSDLQHGMYYKKDNFISDNYIGTFAKKTITKKNVKELIEFLWYSAFGNYNKRGAKVLGSFTEENTDSIKHIIFETRVGYGDWGIHDQIFLIKSIYTVDKNSGKIELTEENIKKLEGKAN